MKDSPNEKVRKISSPYLAINEGFPAGECREDIVPLPGHKMKDSPKEKVGKMSSS
jgi:hypothetical protein